MGADDIPGDIRGGDRSNTSRRLTVAQAAEALGVTVDAIRSRIKRETIEHVREEGRVYVILGDDQGELSIDQGADHSTNVHPDPRDRDELVEELRDRVRALEDANRENRRIIAALTSRIPEIEPPASPEPRDAPETATEGEGRGEVPPESQEPAQHRSWLYRFFFGP